MKRNAGLFAVLLLAACWLLYGLGEQSLWIDEGHTWHDARQAPSLLPGGTPPLYNLLMHGWIRLLPPTEFVLRLPSVLLTLAGIAVLARTLPAGKAWFAVAAALQPFLYWHAQDARMYALVFFACAMLTVTLRNYLHTAPGAPWPGRFRTMCWLLLAIHAQPYAVLFAPGILVPMVWSLRRRALLPLLVLVAGLLPLVLGYSTKMLELNRGAQAPPVAARLQSVAYAAYYAGFGYTGFSLQEHALPLTAAALGAGVLLQAWCWRMALREPGGRAVMLSAVAVPAGLTLISTLAGLTILYPRYLMMVMPGLLILTFGISRNDRAARLAQAGIMLLGVFALVQYHTEPGKQRDDWRQLVTVAREVTAAGGEVACLGPVPHVVRYYERGEMVLSSRTLPPAAGLQAGERWLLLMQRQRGSAAQVCATLAAGGYEPRQVRWQRFVLIRW